MRHVDDQMSDSLVWSRRRRMSSLIMWWTTIEGLLLKSGCGEARREESCTVDGEKILLVASYLGACCRRCNWRMALRGKEWKVANVSSLASLRTCFWAGIIVDFCYSVFCFKYCRRCPKENKNGGGERAV